MRLSGSKTEVRFIGTVVSRERQPAFIDQACTFVRPISGAACEVPCLIRTIPVGYALVSPVSWARPPHAWGARATLRQFDKSGTGVAKEGSRSIARRPPCSLIGSVGSMLRESVVVSWLHHVPEPDAERGPGPAEARSPHGRLHFPSAAFATAWFP